MEKQLQWERLAEPQPDAYDSLQTLDLATRRGYTLKRHESRVMKFDGTVAVLPNHFWDSKQFSPASLEDPNVELGSEMIRAWPAVLEQCRWLLRAIFISNTVGVGADTWGSCSGPGSDGFGSVCATVDHPVGFAEAIVHEMAHHKLRAIGIDFESASQLILNPTEEIFPSPIRYDKMRPMSAVLHAEYSYTYVAALDIAIIRSNSSLSDDIAKFSLAKYLPKLDFGLRVLRRSATTDMAGSVFLAALSGWIEHVLADGKQILSDRAMPFEDFVHPLCATSGQ